MKVKIDDFLEKEFNKINIPYDFSNSISDIMTNKGYRIIFKYEYLKIVACISILLVSLFTFFIINKKGEKVENILANKSVEQNSNTNNIDEKYNNKQPYKIISYISSRAYDVTNLEKLYENVDLIVTGKVIEKDDAQITEIIPTIHTPGKLNVYNIIKGKVSQNTINFIVLGGKVSLEYYETSIKNKYPDNIEKEDFSNLDADFKKQNYILFKDEYSNEFYNQQEYVLFLNKIGNTDEYAVVSYAGMIPVNDASKINSIEQIYNLEKVNKD